MEHGKAEITCKKLPRFSWELQEIPWALGGRKDQPGATKARLWNKLTQPLLLPTIGVFMVGEAVPEVPEFPQVPAAPDSPSWGLAGCGKPGDPRCGQAGAAQLDPHPAAVPGKGDWGWNPTLLLSQGKGIRAGFAIFLPSFALRQTG